MHFKYSQYKQKGLAHIWLIVGIVIITVAGGAYYLGRLTAEKTISTSEIVSQNSQRPSPAVKPVDKTNNWSTYTGKDYSFSYPSNWKLEQSDYLNTVSVTNPRGSVAVQISDGQYPYGFGGDGDPSTIIKKDLSLKVGDKDYIVKEITMGNQAFVDFQLNSPNKNNILFGTGYPAAQGEASLQDYENEKKIILRILSTFKFL